MSDFLFRGDLAEVDPDVQQLSDLEGERQFRRLILIPSESTAPLAVRQALASPFQNIYAEGYPDEATRRMSEAQLLDYALRLGEYRRNSDPRYYKGVEYADTVEALARRRCAEAFATNGVTADGLYVNLQALSGAPANNAVFHALLQPGDTLMGMNLLHGGHLTHGSPASRSGKLYHAVAYSVDPTTEQIDYDAVEALAKEAKPKILIAGYSSYPWTVDWLRFRKIADAVGAYLMADIAHVAGLVVAGACPSPIGIADVVTFTTHKSLCGPRGAAIVTHRKDLGRQIDRAVFPGEQGGPHINTIAAQAVAFKLARSDAFRALQHQIVANCVALTGALQRAGFRIPFGGTNTHLTNVDCRSVRGAEGVPLSGDMAARILDLTGIVVNRNTIPGDTSAANPSGIRLGTPWITQRGFTERETEGLADLIAEILHGCKPYQQRTRRGTGLRARIEFDLLEQARMRVRDMAMAHGIDVETTRHGSPHFYYLDDPLPGPGPVALKLRGESAEALVRWTTTAEVDGLPEGAWVHADLHAAGKAVPVALRRAKDHWLLSLEATEAPRVLAWLRAISDGFVLIDPVDPQRRIPGPLAVEVAEDAERPPKSAARQDGAHKPWFVGAAPGMDKPLPPFLWTAPEAGPVRKTALHAAHKALGAKLVDFAGWEMPVWYSSVVEEHLATRNAAGLFDVSHMGVYQVDGPQACAFLDSVVGNDVDGLAVGESLYTQFLDPAAHVIDDTMVYRIDHQAYLVVVNAANDEKDWAWLNAVRAGSVRVDDVRQAARAFGTGCELRDLRDPKQGGARRVDIALQGPRSREIVLALGCSPADAAGLKALPWAGVMQGVFGEFDLIVSRTGYTGERVAFELFVHPDRAAELWQQLVAVGTPLGMKPIGLGARDSLRTEAGLPLYGHEMGGDLDLGVGQAGFASYVKIHKPWFIGRSAYLEQEAQRTGEVVRFRFDEKGVRMAHLHDPVVDRRGKVIGVVTSCAVDAEGYLTGQAYLLLKSTLEGTPIGIFQSAAREPEVAPASLRLGQRAPVPTAARVLSRFPR
jgi:glycine hydroxymethyltransferase